ALFEVEKPLTTLGIGVDALPVHIRYSPVLTGNNLGQLGNVEHIPSEIECREFKNSGELELLLAQVTESDFASHRLAQQLLAQGEIQKAWKVLLAS
ncbi:MAG TPA: flavin reductase family protein, partial [Flavobacteriales bacterium]|nr:flavin reductase family protein [Flavobacteriales bacterium]